MSNNLNLSPKERPKKGARGLRKDRAKERASSGFPKEEPLPLPLERRRNALLLLPLLPFRREGRRGKGRTPMAF